MFGQLERGPNPLQVLEQARGPFRVAWSDPEGTEHWAAGDHLGHLNWWWRRDPATGDIVVAPALADLVRRELITGEHTHSGPGTGLLAAPGPDHGQVAALLAGFRLDPARTVFDGVHVVPPGHALHATRRSHSLDVQLRAYWSPPAVDPSLDAADAAVLVRSAVDAAIRRGVESSSTGRIASFLSGGLDSSSIAGVLHRMGLHPVLLAARFPGLPSDESVFQDAVVRGTGLRLVTQDTGVVDLDELAGRIRATRLPFVRPDAEYDALLRSAAAEGYDIALCGDGGDLALQWWGDPVPDLLAAGRPVTAAGELRRRGTRTVLRAVASAGLRALPDSVRRRRLAAHAPAWLTPHGATLAAEAALLPQRFAAWTDAGSRRAYWADGVGAGATERTALGVGLRFPFLDVDVVEAAARLAPWVRGGPDDDRRLQRACFADVLPPALLARRGKVHFDAKLVQQFAECGAPSILKGMALEGAGLVDGAAARREADRLIASVRRGPEHVEPGIHRLWTLVSVELWWREVTRPAG